MPSLRKCFQLLGLTVGWCGLGFLAAVPVLAQPAAHPQPRRQAVWSFDAPAGARQLQGAGRPEVGTTTTRVPGVRGDGVAVREAGAPVILPLPAAAPEGSGVNPLAMAVRFWFRPDWSSAGTLGGSGPGGRARLLSMGDVAAGSADGWWELAINPAGDRFELVSGSGKGGRDTFSLSSSSVSLTAGRWTEILVNFFPGGVQIHQDNVLVASAAPPRLSGPGPAALRRGLAVGSGLDGSEPARGTLDELEILNAPLGRVEQGKGVHVFWAEPGSDADAGALRIQWRGPAMDGVELRRFELGDTNAVLVFKGAGVQEYVDREVVPGRRYLYRLTSGGRPKAGELVAGLRVAPIEDRGAVALLVDETLATGLSPELSRLERELVGDGWKVLRHNVARHDDENWSRNTNAIARIRAQVRADWESTGKALRCLYLIGHVATPYSGMRAEDLHSGKGDNHWGAWPADQYYGDVDGIWADREPYPTFLAPVTFPVTRNDPGDGKFDTEHVPPNAAGDTRLEMAFGRLDFVRMPLFGRGTRGEIDLIRQYLDKVRRYRMGNMPARPAAVANGYFQNGVDMDLLVNAYRTGSRLYGGGAESVFEGDLFRLPEGGAVAWGFQSGAGYIDRIRTGSPGMVTSAQLTEPRRQARVLFAMLLGSWFGDWAAGENNLLRAITASREYGLAAMWVRTAEWRFDPMALGGTLGDGQLLTANEGVRYQDPNHGTTRTLTILGDPTLRAHVVPPVRGLKGQRTGNTTQLSWAAGGGEIVGWNVYRSVDGPKGRYLRANGSLLTEREFTDADAPRGTVYLVRAAQLVATGSGSYTNLSQGVFWP